MSEKNNGGPAFPVDFDFHTFEPSTVDEAKRLMSGMTLRDYFASKAMQALLEARTVNKSGVVGVNCFEYQIAGHAYAIADAMLRTREAT